MSTRPPRAPDDETAGSDAAHRFLVDLNVGRLAKWLRVLGYDSLFLPEADDNELLRIAAEQGRTILTSDHYILERRVVKTGQVKVLLTKSDDFREQLRDVVETLGLDSRNLFSLCIECNEHLRSVEKQRVRERVPPFVLRTQEKFYECPVCAKVYWRGTHWSNMRAELTGIAGEGEWSRKRPSYTLIIYPVTS